MTEDTRDRLATSKVNIQPGSVFYGFEGKKGSVIGDFYFDNNWQDGLAVFYPIATVTRPDTIAGVPMRYDIHNSELEFNTPYGIKALPEKEVRQFEFKTKSGAITALFVNANEVKGAPEKTGFYEVLSKGRLTLLLQHKVWIKAPTYNVALDTGTRDTEILKLKAYFYQKNGKLQKFKPTNGGLLKIMQDKKTDVEDFLAANPLDAGNPATVASVFNFYNSLK
ncbi:MAG: hypothetical protein HY842_03810 [Bacteroidetes bacterium]|nr:hypothetical protein [Bacteroidota bacterium]